MRDQPSPPLFTQVIAGFAVLGGIAIAISVIAVSPHHTEFPSQDPVPWWTGLLQTSRLLLLISFPALGHCLMYAPYRSGGRKAGFRRVLFFGFATLTVTSNLIFFGMTTENIWIPSHLESVLHFGMGPGAAFLLVTTVCLFFCERKLFWVGLGIAVGAIVVRHLPSN